MEEVVKQGMAHGAKKVLVKVVRNAISIFIIAVLAFGLINAFLGWGGFYVSVSFCELLLPILLGVIILLIMIEKIAKLEQISRLRKFLLQVFLFCGVYFVASMLVFGLWDQGNDLTPTDRYNEIFHIHFDDSER